MRIKKGGQEVSFTVSEIPMEDQTHRERFIEENSMQLIKEEEMEHKPKRAQSAKGVKQNQHEELEGRVAFRGKITQLNKTKKEKFMQDGSQMLQVQKDIKMTEDKIQLLQSRINALQRKEQSTKKRVETIQTKKVQAQESQKNISRQRELKLEIEVKKQEELKHNKEKIERIKTEQELGRTKVGQEMINKQNKIRMSNMQQTEEVKQKLEENKKLSEEEKKQKHERILQEKNEALEKRRKDEMRFLGRIKHQYHKERDQKEKMKQDNEELIRMLEEKEKDLMSQLTETMQLEQMERESMGQYGGDARSPPKVAGQSMKSSPSAHHIRARHQRGSNGAITYHQKQEVPAIKVNQDSQPATFEAEKKEPTDKNMLSASHASHGTGAKVTRYHYAKKQEDEKKKEEERKKNLADKNRQNLDIQFNSPEQKKNDTLATKTAKNQMSKSLYRSTASSAMKQSNRSPSTSKVDKSPEMQNYAREDQQAIPVYSPAKPKQEAKKSKKDYDTKLLDKQFAGMENHFSPRVEKDRELNEQQLIEDERMHQSMQIQYQEQSKMFNESHLDEPDSATMNSERKRAQMLNKNKNY